MTQASSERAGTEVRPGERALDFDPANEPHPGGLVFIGKVQSPWTARQDCPKNMAAAHETGQPASIVIDAAYRDGLEGLEAYPDLVVLTWLDRAARNLIVQHPRHAPEPRGTFALRSPVRPNPIGLHVVRVTGIDRAAGLISLAAIDVLDGTPILDIKPYYQSTDWPGSRA